MAPHPDAVLAAAVTGHKRYLALCDPDSPDYRPAYLSIVAGIASKARGPSTAPAEVEALLAAAEARPYESLDWLRRWALAGRDPVAEVRRYTTPRGVADVGDGVFVTDCHECMPNLASFDLSVHIWKPENLVTDGACPRVVAGTGPGLKVEYEEGALLDTMRPPLAEVLAYMAQPGRLLIHCAGGRHRAPTLASLAKVMRGESPRVAMDEVVRANREQRGVVEAIPGPPAGEIARMDDPPPRVPIVGWLHIAIMGNWESILREQLSAIERSGLRAASTRIFAGVVGPETDLSWLPDWITIAKRDGPLSMGENSTLQALWDWSKTGLASKVWYLHTKGASHGPDKPNITFWRDYLMYWNVSRWRDCAAALEDYDAAGVDYVVPGENGDWFRKLWAVPHLRGAGFCGNFWWSTSIYLSGMSPDKVILNRDRMDSEWDFVGSSSPRVRNFHLCKVNPYLTPLSRAGYEPPTPLVPLPRSEKPRGSLADATRAKRECAPCRAAAEAAKALPSPAALSSPGDE